MEWLIGDSAGERVTCLILISQRCFGIREEYIWLIYNMGIDGLEKTQA